jgi:hypothetical protein
MQRDCKKSETQNLLYMLLHLKKLTPFSKMIFFICCMNIIIILLPSCQQNHFKLKTDLAIGISSNSASISSEMQNLHGDTVIQYGHCWSTVANPSTDAIHTTHTSAIKDGNFASSLSNLNPGTQYYVRAYAYTTMGTFYGNEVSFTTNAKKENVTSCSEIPPGIDALFHRLPDHTSIVIDGVEEDTWNNTAMVPVKKAVDHENPTVTCYWKGLWDDTCVYVLISVSDDDHFPGWINGGTTWEFDMPEIYFDVNDTLTDGLGPINFNSGHYQFSPGFEKNGYGIVHERHANANNPHSKYAYVLTGESYLYECAFYFSDFKNKHGQHLYLSRIAASSKAIGFDVTIVDQDEGITTGRQRMVWMNSNGTDTESWNNMDECGKVMFCYDYK